MRGSPCDGSRAWGLFLVFVVTAATLAGGAGIGISADGAPEGERAGRPLDPQSGVWFEEVVTHPHSDWQDNERATSVDEYLVLRNFGSEAVDASGWVVHMLDGTDEKLELEGPLAPGEAFVVLNPPGQINNDVRLLLVDGDNETVDDVRLGEGGVPSGRGADPLDEAVHLAGSWAGLRAPGTLGAGLGPIWVSHLAAAGVIEHAGALQAGWFAPEGGRVEVRVHAAPGVDPGALSLGVGADSFDLERLQGSGGVWRSGVLPAGSGDAFALRLASPHGAVDAFPDGSPLSFVIDRQAPGLQSLEWPTYDAGGLRDAVADADGRIRWLPEAFAGSSGLVSVAVRDPTTGERLPDCLPLTAPGPGCVVDADAGSLILEIADGAGRQVEKNLSVVVWDEPPSLPDLAFQSGPSPTMGWNLSRRPLGEVRLESAQDVTGAWPVHEHVLAGNATRFVDPDWEPGAPRAYRLTLTDLAGNAATGPWVALDPRHVPVQVEMEPSSPLVEKQLADSGEVELVLRFDRPLEQAPRLALRLDAPRPVYEEVAGEPVINGSSYSYLVRLSEPVPEAMGEWSLVGGKSVDGAPFATIAGNVSWDEKAPRVEFSGSSGDWIRDVRHVIAVNAVDTLDPSPSVSFTNLPGNATVSDPSSAPRVTLQGEGIFQVEGEVVDNRGNAATFGLRVGLDASPPGVRELERPVEWSIESPLRVEFTDAVSGVNESSLQVWVRNASGIHDARLLSWDDPVATWVPGNGTGTVRGPFEVYLAAADHAGNGVEGFLSGRLLEHPGEPAENGSGEPVHAGLSEQETPSSPAPSFLGPPWDAGMGEGSRGSGEAKRDEGGASVRSSNSSAWDGFSWDDVASDSDGRPFGWYLFAFAGIVGLGTVAHRVRKRRRGTDAAREPGSDDRPRGQQDPEEETAQEETSALHVSSGMRARAQEAPGLDEQAHREHGPVDETRAARGGQGASGHAPSSSAAATRSSPRDVWDETLYGSAGPAGCPVESVGEVSGGVFQWRLESHDGSFDPAGCGAGDASFVVVHDFG